MYFGCDQVWVKMEGKASCYIFDVATVGLVEMFFRVREKCRGRTAGLGVELKPSILSILLEMDLRVTKLRHKASNWWGGPLPDLGS